MKGFILTVICLLFSLSVFAQNGKQAEGKVFNFGATVGFNAAFPIINSLIIDGIEVQDIRLQYKVGYLASVFCRINAARFFIQPSFSWNRAEGEIHFTIPPTSSLKVHTIQSDQLAFRTKSLEMPVLIGYNIVREGPYGLSFMVGPKLKYNYDVSYTSQLSNSSHEFVSDDTPYGISICTGVSVSIWRLFLDFGYEFGLNQVESSFKDKYERSSSIADDISINKRTNVMNFSLGFLF